MVMEDLVFSKQDDRDSNDEITCGWFWDAGSIGPGLLITMSLRQLGLKVGHDIC